MLTKFWQYGIIKPQIKSILIWEKRSTCIVNNKARTFVVVYVQLGDGEMEVYHEKE